MKIRKAHLGTRILLDFSIVANGGSETYATGFLNALAKRDADSLLVVLLPAAPVLKEQEERLEAAGITVVRSRTRAAGTWRSRLEAQLRLPALIIRWRPSAVFVPREVAPLLAPAPIVVLVHNRNAWTASPVAGGGKVAIKSRLNRLAARLSVQRAAALIVTTDVMLDCVPLQCQAKAMTVHQGCDLAPVDREAKARGLPDRGPLRLIAVGSMSPHKGFDIVIRTVAELRRRGVDVMLDLWGPPGTPDISQSLIELAETSLGTNPLRGVYSLDCRSSIYASADILMMGSSFESFGHPMVEAMRTSTVVLAPRSSLVHELCGESAITYEEGQFESAADAVEVALPDLASWAQRGHKRSHEFSWESCVEKTIAACKSIGSKEPKFSGQPTASPEEPTHLSSSDLALEKYRPWRNPL